jgi:heme/copper-type cytochrome/quinol oxidase subunit 4
VAAGIALPLILHRIAPKPPKHQLPTEQPAPPGAALPASPLPLADQPPADQPAETPVAAASPGRRGLGILLACLAIPLGIAVAVGLLAVDFELGWILGLVAMVGLAIIGYLTAGVRAGTSVFAPIAIIGIAAVAFIGEVAVWAGFLFADENATVMRIIGGLVIVAIPVITTTVILAAGRRRSRPQIPGGP